MPWPAARIIMLSDMMKLSLLNDEQVSNHHADNSINMMMKRRLNGELYFRNDRNDRVTFVGLHISPELQSFAVGHGRNQHHR